MGIIEGFATVVLEEEEIEDQYNYQLRFFLLVLMIKLLLIYLVGKFLWPKVMPKISSSIKPNPGFLNLLGLSVIIHIVL